MRSVGRAVVALGLAAVWHQPTLAQVSAFRYQADRAPAGLTLHYRKSNLDGTHPADIVLHVAGDRLESFKWNGDTTATLVKAWLEPARLTVRRFESWRLAGESRRLVAVLEAGAGDAMVLELGGKRTESVIRNWPWHSYDFDFAGLGAALPHLVAPESRFTIGIADIAPTSAGVAMADLGPVEVAFVRRERWNGRETRRYTIDGPGLERRGGTLWADGETGLLAGFEIQKPDEEGFESGKLVLTRAERMDEAGWMGFMQSRLRP